MAPRYARDANDPWAGSPFEWILKVPSRSKGAVAEALVAEWAETRGFSVKRSPHSDADRIINGHRVEIKLSTLWETGKFKFQQIRNQDYDYCLCIAISPFDVHAWLLPKPVLLTHVIGFMGQHNGAAGKDTDWIGFNRGAPYDWMKPYGDRLGDVAELLKSNGRGNY